MPEPLKSSQQAELEPNPTQADRDFNCEPPGSAQSHSAAFRSHRAARTGRHLNAVDTQINGYLAEQQRVGGRRAGSNA
ncbi:hypothetical protein EYF80_003046 [Liparis tanakae]|uniref:Uncharacterized protein n=1 Tax=Liparis tanakae TaxID=230148 RepID=A0A4Z2JAT8_9TELE|nr:hypothetical protein EYF80_003046 [Liparis tanakae]